MNEEETKGRRKHYPHLLKKKPGCPSQQELRKAAVSGKTEAEKRKMDRNGVRGN